MTAPTSPLPYVQPLLMPWRLAFVRGVYTTAGWSLLAFPGLLVFSCMRVLVHNYDVLLGHVQEGTTAAAERLTQATAEAALVLTAVSLAIAFTLWFVLSSMQLRAAEDTAKHCRASAQDAADLEGSAALCFSVVLEVLAWPAAGVGALLAFIMAIVNDPEIGGWIAAPLALIPAGVVGLLWLFFHVFVLPRRERRFCAVKEQWPHVTSTPRSIAEIRKDIERKESFSTGSSPTPQPLHGRRRADSRFVFLTRMGIRPLHVFLFLGGVSLIGLFLCSVLELPEKFTSIPGFALVLTVGALVLTSVTPVLRSTPRRWHEYIVTDPAEAAVEQYGQCHPFVICGIVCAGYGSNALWIGHSLEEVSKAHISSASFSTGLTLIFTGIFALACAATLCAYGHKATRDWQARYLATHPAQDPTFTHEVENPFLTVLSWFTEKHS